MVVLFEEKRGYDENENSTSVNSAQGGGESGGGKNKRRTTSSRLWTPYGDPAREQRSSSENERRAETEEELKKRIEEALEKLTVEDIVLDMLVSLASIAYQKMGIPKDVNAKYKDMDQARLAIDCIDAIVKTLSDRISREKLQPLVGTLDNLKLNYAKEL